MFKKVILSVLLLGSLFLVACSESKSDKEVTVDTFNSMMEASSYDATTTIDFNFDFETQDPMEEQVLQAINDAELSVDQRVDQEQQKQEMVINVKAAFSPFTFDLQIPVLQDMKNYKMYLETNSLAENLGMFLNIPEEYKDNVVEIDLSEDMAELEANELDYEAIQEEAMTIFKDHLDEKSEEDFSSDENQYTVTFTSEEFSELTADLVSSLDETMSDEEIDQGIEEINTGLEEINLETFDVNFTVEDDQIQSMSFSTDIEVEEAGQTFKMSFSAETVYNSINEGVEFTIDPENSESITIEELEEIMLMQGY
ncbi:hypothetical protein [Aquisalibacillus elongatus]|uniref:Lipoprotein n=1 Tax=Aquisalibacillus elongatus TaxID=485577 RepID=A0A3N5C202_9BACI|nr:hypothetical protein [Aquisalibacillus elongatus]RPF53392.1 hypothetical protein EDC24_1891 [Aquisalibacillus elongatus]